MKFAIATDKRRRADAFTLAEVLAALMFMAIVIPVAVQALHVAALSGRFAARKAEATRVADKVLNESIVTTNWLSAAMTGTVIENGNEYHWNVLNESWQQASTMKLLIAEVTFTAGGRECMVRLNTLAGSPSSSSSSTTTMTGQQ